MKKIYKAVLLIIGIFAIFVFARIGLCSYIDYTMGKNIPSSSVPVDVVLVAATKDFDMVPHSIESVRKYLKQPINKAVLIAPKSDESLKLAKSLNMEFMDEDNFLSLVNFKLWVKDNGLTHTYPSLTWYYQQFLKLLYYKVSVADYYFVIDADVVMKRPFVLVSDDKVHTFFVGKNDLHDMSKISIKQLLGEQQYVADFSYIADLMCFNKNITKQLIEEIEMRSGVDFYKAAILAEQHTGAEFSEYELYGAYANQGNKHDFLISYLPSNYASKDYLKNYLDTYHYLSDSHTRRRISLLWDKYSPGLKAYPYVAYHSWLGK